MTQYPNVPGFNAVQQPDGTVRYEPAQQQQAMPQQQVPQQQFAQPPQQQQFQQPAQQPAPQLHAQHGQGPYVAGNMPQQAQHPAVGGVGQGAYAFQQGQAPSPAMPSQQAMAPQAPTGFYLPTDADMQRMSSEANAINERIAAARAGGGGRGNLKFLKMLGPQGQESWGPNSGVQIGYLAERIFRLLPSPNAGELHYIVADKHFWKSHQHPKGAGMWCPGKEQCLLCQAVEPALATGSGQLYDQAKKWGRARAHFLYQGFAYDAVAEHVGEDGLFYPMVLDAGSTLHSAIVKIIEKRGSMSILHPGHGGRPLTIGKKKTGKALTDCEWSALDMPEYAGPIPQEFRVGPNGEGLNLIDLKKLVKLPELADMQAAVIEIGLMQQTPMSYNPNPQPPNPSPYGQQMPQTGAYPAAMGAPPAYQQPAMPPAPAPVGGGMPPQQQQFGQHQLPTMGAPQQPPPPVPQVPQGAAPSGYSPQPSQAAAGAYQPPLPAGPPPVPAAVSGSTQPQVQMPPQVQPGQVPPQQAQTPPPAQMPPQPPAGNPAMPPQAQPNQAMTQLEAQLRGQAPAPAPGAPAAPPPPNAAAAPPPPPAPQQQAQPTGNGAMVPGAPPPPNMAAPPPGTQGPGF
jgi:hypothetical protein